MEETKIKTANLLDDVVTLPIYDDPFRKELAVKHDAVDTVIRIGNPNICKVVINTVEYTVDLPAQKVCEMIYGGIGDCV